MTKIEIAPAYSAQPSIAKPNPFLSVAIEHMFSNGLVSEDDVNLRVADQGCGKLRHLELLSQHFSTIYLIDLEFQLTRIQRLFGLEISVRDYIAKHSIPGKELIALPDSDFGSTKLSLDAVFNICVFDVVVPKTRKALIAAAHRNMKNGGLYVVIVPRNDRSILNRCKQKNEYLDGHIFHHHGVTTFYKNHSNAKALTQSIAEQGFTLEIDLSRHRQICLILRK